MVETADLRKWLPWVLGAIFAIALIALIVDVYIYSKVFEGAISSEHDRWGTFGDFLGGTLNPIFALLGLLALLLTIVLQSRELENSTRELKNSADALRDQSAALKKQNFEQTFFQMVRLHLDIVKDLEVRNSNSADGLVSGRTCIREFYKRLQKCHSIANSEFSSEG